MWVDNTLELLEALPTDNIFRIDSAAWIQMLYVGPFYAIKLLCVDMVLGFRGTSYVILYKQVDIKIWN